MTFINGVDADDGGSLVEAMNVFVVDGSANLVSLATELSVVAADAKFEAEVDEAILAGIVLLRELLFVGKLLDASCCWSEVID